MKNHTINGAVIAPATRIAVLGAALSLLAAQAPAIYTIPNYSPRNRERPRRSATHYIILHTTEAPARSSLNKLRDRGEAHYLVDPLGRIYRIIDKDRVAYHAGISMWNGVRNLDNCSVGVEVVGYHNKDITEEQYKAVKELVAWLQGIYRVRDDRVLTHSMVAYSPPNTWHRRPHRGRKRCGMIFANKTARRKLGLNSEPKYDPDVRAGRLVVADTYLARMLYNSPEPPMSRPQTAADVIGPGRSAWQIAGAKYNSADIAYLFPDGRKLNGAEITDWKSVPAGTKVLVGQADADAVPDGVKVLPSGAAASTGVPGNRARNKSTLYLLPNRAVKTGEELSDAELNAMPAQARVLSGYTFAGTIGPRKSAFQICGAKWNLASTLYRFPNEYLCPGNEVNERTIRPNTQVFVRDEPGE